MNEKLCQEKYGLWVRPGSVHMWAKFVWRHYLKSLFEGNIVTKFGYLLYWDIMGAPRHIPGQALFCVNIGNGWNSVCNNCFNYSNLYWVKLWVIWINSEFEFKYIRLIIRYWFCSTIHYLGDEIYSGARFECWRQAGSVLLYSERGAWRVKLM